MFVIKLRSSINKIMEGYYSSIELEKIGFKSIGHDVLISKKTSIYMPEKITIANYVRIDDFSLLIGNIDVESYVHIGAYCGLHASGKGRIIFKKYSGISSNVNVYASSDSFDGEYMTGRHGILDSCTNVLYGEVVFGEYSQCGTGCTILQNAKLGEGTAIYAMSLVNEELLPWSIYAGIPCKKVKERRKDLLNKLEVYNE